MPVTQHQADRRGNSDEEGGSDCEGMGGSLENVRTFPSISL